MVAETRKKSSRKRKRSRNQRKPVDRTRMWVLITLGVFVLLGIVSTVAFDDRHWQAFDAAGDVAFERENYKYAERMYNEALQEARNLENRELIRASLQALSRAYAAQGRSTEARAAQQAAP